jgi:hypothetical protein
MYVKQVDHGQLVYQQQVPMLMEQMFDFQVYVKLNEQLVEVENLQKMLVNFLFHVQLYK